MRRLLILVVLVGLVAGFLFLWDLPQEKRQQEREAIERQLLIFNPTTVDTLRIERPGGSLTLARSGESWQLLTPVHEMADGDAVARQLAALADAERLRPLPDIDINDNLTVYGLAGREDGTVEVFVRDTSGDQVTLRIGQENPSGTGTYVQRGVGQPVELAEASLASLVRATYHSFREHVLFAVAESSVVSVEVQAGDISYEGTRDDRGLWHQSTGVRLQRWKMRSLVYDLATARIRKYVADGLKPDHWRGYGLHEPLADIRFTTDDGRAHRIRIGNEGEDKLVYGRRDDAPVLFLLPPQLLVAAEVPLESLVDTSPLEFNFDRLDSLRVVWEDGSNFGVARGADGWDPHPMPDDPAEVESLRTPLRNVLYGLERTQTVGTMLLAQGTSPGDVLDRQPLRCELFWPGERVDFALGWRRGEEDHWLHVDGAAEMHRVPRDLFLRLRGYLISAGRLEM